MTRGRFLSSSSANSQHRRRGGLDKHGNTSTSAEANRQGSDSHWHMHGRGSSIMLVQGIDSSIDGVVLKAPRRTLKICGVLAISEAWQQCTGPMALLQISFEWDMLAEQPRYVDAHMLKLELWAGDSEGSLGLEELAELLYALPKGIALSSDVNGLPLLHGRKRLSSASDHRHHQYPKELRQICMLAILAFCWGCYVLLCNGSACGVSLLFWS